MSKRAIFPGSFDPFTVGHYDIVKRGLELFDEIIIGIGRNSTKKETFPIRAYGQTAAYGFLLFLEEISHDEARRAQSRIAR